MLDFAIFAVTFVTVLIAVVFYLYPGSRKSGTTIPGLNPADPKEGNLPDIQLSGSFHQFLENLHQKHGAIASFWLESQLAVSLASPTLFKEHQHAFDRPGDLYSVFQPLLGKNSIYFSNGTSTRPKHKLLVDVFDKASLDLFFPIYKQTSNEVISKLESLPDAQQVPLHQYMMALSMKTLLLTLFGDQFKENAKILEFRRSFDICISDIDLKLQGKLLDENEAREKMVDLAIQKVRSQLKDAVSNLNTQQISLLSKTWLNSTTSEEQRIDDSILTLFQGFQTTGNLLTWLLYYVATHADIQSKVLAEIQSVAGDGDLTPEHLKKLTYLRQVLNETLRISNLITFTARYQDTPVEIGGHIIPKGTPVIHAIGVVANDSQIWQSPDKFDPERFSPEQVVSRPTLTFAPFGFAGKRACPGQSFPMTFVTLFLAQLLRRRQIKLVDGQVVLPRYCSVTQPEDEIWVTTSKQTH